MTERKVLVTGATGLLGRQMAKLFRQKEFNVTQTAHSRADGVDILKLDLGDSTSISRILEETQPSIIVHCAAQRFPDKVDKDPEAARQLNILASKTLASLAASKGVFFIYISTDYVFSGAPGQAPYESDAATGPTNLYGQTKLDGEKAVLEEFSKADKKGNGVVFRVPVLYGRAENPSESAVNVLMDVVWNAQTQGQKTKMDHWALRYPTNTEDVARVCHDVAMKYLAASDRSDLPTVLQFSSEDVMTKYEICQTFGEIMGLSTENIEPNTDGNDPNASVQRPYDCHLSTKALKEVEIDVRTMNFVDWWRRELGAFRK